MRVHFFLALFGKKKKKPSRHCADDSDLGDCAAALPLRPGDGRAVDALELVQRYGGACKAWGGKGAKGARAGQGQGQDEGREGKKREVIYFRGGVGTVGTGRVSLSQSFLDV